MTCASTSRLSEANVVVALCVSDGSGEVWLARGLLPLKRSGSCRPCCH